MEELIEVFGDLELRRSADGSEVFVDRVDGSVYAFPTTVGQPADEAGEPPNRSDEEPIVA